MKNHLHIVRKSYLGGCRINDCLPTVYDDVNMVILKNINDCLPTVYDDVNMVILKNMGVVSACFI